MGSYASPNIELNNLRYGASNVQERQAQKYQPLHCDCKHNCTHLVEHILWPEGALDKSWKSLEVTGGTQGPCEDNLPYCHKNFGTTTVL